MRKFLVFSAFSGVGWILDFAAFTTMVTVLAISGDVANFISSYIGVTFVYFTALKTVFKRRDERGALFLYIYWGFQFCSILTYSKLLQMLVLAVPDVGVPLIVVNNAEIAAKIIVTPFNLVTNYIFMKILTGFMREENPARV